MLRKMLIGPIYRVPHPYYRPALGHVYAPPPDYMVRHVWRLLM